MATSIPIKDSNQIPYNKQYENGLYDNKGSNSNVLFGNKNNSRFNQNEFIYDLYAVSNHIGSGNSGHYTSYVLVNSEEGESNIIEISKKSLLEKSQWVAFNDEEVNFVE